MLKKIFLTLALMTSTQAMCCEYCHQWIKESFYIEQKYALKSLNKNSKVFHSGQMNAYAKMLITIQKFHPEYGEDQ